MHYVIGDIHNELHIYSVGLHTFQEIAKEAGAVYHIKRRVLVNTEIVDQYLEAFRDDPI